MTCSCPVRDLLNTIARREKDSSRALPHFSKRPEQLREWKELQAPRDLCGSDSPHHQCSKTGRAQHISVFRVTDMEIQQKTTSNSWVPLESVETVDHLEPIQPALLCLIWLKEEQHQWCRMGHFNQLGVGETKRLRQILPCRGSLEKQLYPPAGSLEALMEAVPPAYI